MSADQWRSTFPDFEPHLSTYPQKHFRRDQHDTRSPDHLEFNAGPQSVSMLNPTSPSVRPSSAVQPSMSESEIVRALRGPSACIGALPPTLRVLHTNNLSTGDAEAPPGSQLEVRLIPLAPNRLWPPSSATLTSYC